MRDEGNADGIENGDAASGTDTATDADSAANVTTDTDAGADATADTTEGDTFGVGIHVTAEEFRFVVHVPSDIDAGWTDPDEFQRRIEQVTWETLDQRATLRAVDKVADDEETVTLGTVTMLPDGAVLDRSLSQPAVE